MPINYSDKYFGWYTGDIDIYVNYLVNLSYLQCTKDSESENVSMKDFYAFMEELVWGTCMWKV